MRYTIAIYHPSSSTLDTDFRSTQGSAHIRERAGPIFQGNCHILH